MTFLSDPGVAPRTHTRDTSGDKKMITSKTTQNMCTHAHVVLSDILIHNTAADRVIDM